MPWRDSLGGPLVGYPAQRARKREETRDMLLTHPQTWTPEDLAAAGVFSPGATRDAGSVTLAGFVPYWHLSDHRPGNVLDGPTYRTILVPGCFADSIATAAAGRGNGIRLLAAHDSTRQLATTADNSLTLREGDDGLHWHARVSSRPESVRFCSPLFGGTRCELRTFSTGEVVQVVHRALLLELSIVDRPAFGLKARAWVAAC